MRTLLTLLPRATIRICLMPLLLAGCAHETLEARPPSGVDLSGRWKLNVADSDDPMRLTQAALASATASAGPGGTQSPQGGGGGGGGRGQRGAGPGGFAGPLGPTPPSVMMLDEALRWPGRELTIDQSGTSVTFSSGGRAETCRPGEHSHGAPKPRDDPHSHDAPIRGRGDAPPPECGWDEAALVLKPRDVEEAHPAFDAAFSLSDDRQRLIEVVTFHSGRSSGFTASRVWDRVVAADSSGSSSTTSGSAVSPSGSSTSGPVPSGGSPAPPGAPPR